MFPRPLTSLNFKGVTADHMSKAFLISALVVAVGKSEPLKKKIRRRVIGQ